MEFSIVANPIFIPIAFAANGIKNLIQKVRQVGQDPEDFTWSEGAPLITMTKIEDGGKAPKGQDVNGVLNALSEHVIYGQNGNRYTWSQDVVNGFGGYALGAIIQSDDTTKEFRSLVANNTVNPNNGLGGVWEIYSGQGSIPIATSTTAGITKVLNVLNSNDVGSALSAAQGKALNDIFARFSGSLSANGGCTIVLGNTGQNLVVQWGLISGMAFQENRTIVFPQAFPNACLNLQINSYSTEFTTTYENAISLTSPPSRTQFSVRNMWVGDDSGSFKNANAYWFAIGY